MFKIALGVNRTVSFGLASYQKSEIKHGLIGSNLGQVYCSSLDLVKYNNKWIPFSG